MPSGDNRSPRSGRPGLALVLAVAFLAMIGASVGVVAGTRQLRSQAATIGSESGPAGNRPEQTRSPSQPGRTAPSRIGSSCPPPTVLAIAARSSGQGGVRIVLYIETALSQVWICMGPDGVMWYQGLRKTPAGDGYPAQSLVDGDNAVLLPAGLLGAGRYEATNAGTTYLVSTTRLLITAPDSTVLNETVLNHIP